MVGSRRWDLSTGRLFILPCGFAPPWISNVSVFSTILLAKSHLQQLPHSSRRRLLHLALSHSCIRPSIKTSNCKANKSSVAYAVRAEALRPLAGICFQFSRRLWSNRLPSTSCSPRRARKVRTSLSRVLILAFYIPYYHSGCKPTWLNCLALGPSASDTTYRLDRKT